MKRVGIYIYQGMTMLDVAAPQQILGLAPELEVFTVAPTLDPVITDTGWKILPDHDFASAPHIDVLLVGGAADPSRELADPEVVAWFRKVGAEAEYVTSVCTGSLVLAEAGLLDGYRATTHWAYVDDLRRYPGVEVVDARVVRDRNRFVGGGVTAGLDFAFYFLTEVFGAEVANAMQLIAEYDPEPAGDFGHPRCAPAELVSAVREMLPPMRAGLDAFMATKS